MRATAHRIGQQIGQVGDLAHRHYINGLRLPAYAAEKTCTVVILGLPTAKSLLLRWGPLLSLFQFSIHVDLLNLSSKHGHVALSQIRGDKLP